MRAPGGIRMGKLGKLVLVVAQGTALRARIARLLQPAGYAVELAADERRALDLAAHEGVDAAILAIGSSLADLAFARRLSDRVQRLIVLAERSTDMARLDHSFPDAGVQQSQPLDEQKLLGRLAEMIAAPSEDPMALAPAALRIEGCRIDLPGRTFVHADGREVALTRAEFALLIAFVRNPGHVLSRDQLSQAMAGHGEEMYGGGIDMHVGRLRRKIEPNPKVPRFIITVSGAGYKFAAGPRTVEESREPPSVIEPKEQFEAAPERARPPSSAGSSTPARARSPAWVEALPLSQGKRFLRYSAIPRPMRTMRNGPCTQGLILPQRWWNSYGPPANRCRYESELRRAWS